MERAARRPSCSRHCPFERDCYAITSLFQKMPCDWFPHRALDDDDENNRIQYREVRAHRGDVRSSGGATSRDLCLLKLARAPSAARCFYSDPLPDLAASCPGHTTMHVRFGP